MKRLYILILYDLRSQLRERGTAALLLAALALACFGLSEGARFERHSAASAAAARAQESSERAEANALAARYFGHDPAPELARLQWYKTALDVRGYAFRVHTGYADRPALPGAALAIAQADLLPSYVRVRAESMESARTALEIEHPGRLAAGRYDLLFFVVYLWPLVLLALATPVLTQEREAGRLRALQLQGVRRGGLLLAQVTARCTAAAVLLVAVCGSAALLGGAVPASAAGLAAIATWAGVVLLYTLFWAAVAIAVCAVCGSRTSAAFAGFGAWVALALVLPAALGVAIQQAAPLPARESYVRAMRDAADRVQADKLNSLARFYDSHPDWKPVHTPLAQVSSSVSRLQRAQELERAMAPVNAQYEDARRRQQRMFNLYMVFSPVTLAYQTLSHIAGHDAARQQQFMAEVQAHHQRLRDYFQRVIQLSALGDEIHPCPTICLGGYGFRDFDQVPRFSASSALQAAVHPAPQLAALPLWCAALLALAAWLLRRARHHFAE